MPDIQGTFLFDGIPINGATAKLYAAATLGTAPSKDTALPGSGLLDTVTTGTTYGFDGSYRFSSVSTGQYYVGITYDGHVIWDDHYVPISEQSVAMVLMAGYTPTGTGADVAEIPVPYSAADGTTSITYNIRRITFRVATAGGAPSLKVQKSTAGNAAFSGTDVDTLTIASGEYQVSTTSSFDSSTVASGNLLRVNVLTLASAQSWTVVVELEGQ